MGYENDSIKVYVPPFDYGTNQSLFFDKIGNLYDVNGRPWQTSCRGCRCWGNKVSSNTEENRHGEILKPLPVDSLYVIDLNNPCPTYL